MRAQWTDRYAVWRRGSRPRRSPGTTVSSLTPGEILKGAEYFFSRSVSFCQQWGATWPHTFLPMLKYFCFFHERFVSVFIWASLTSLQWVGLHWEMWCHTSLHQSESMNTSMPSPHGLTKHYKIKHIKIRLTYFQTRKTKSNDSCGFIYSCQVLNLYPDCVNV